jgi:hypothetical protein
MVLNAAAGDIPSISKALNSLDSAFSSTSTAVPTIQDALQSLRNALLLEAFVDAAVDTNSQQYILQEAALRSSLQQLTSVMTEVQLRLTAFQQSVTSLTVTEPEDLLNDEEILTALHLAVCGPKINWYLVNKAFESLVSLTTQNSTRYPSIESRKLLVFQVMLAVSFRPDVMKIFASGDMQISTCLEALNTVFGQYKDRIGCSYQ